ncbi:MAG: 5'/3'-nucleotidase SurE [Candidatus Aminicenantes bacterium]|nr:5'/3'-nucleotidase SurE [Candidatus Aminicenantes bacterium]
MNILLTNDDGYLSVGINFLRRALLDLGHRVLVVAPDKERSAVSKALTLHRPLRMRKIEDDFYITDGTPNDCIYLALGVLLKNKPDMVVSGINHGANLGDDVIYSGTVGAAILATHFRIPSVAFSFAHRDMSEIGKVAKKAGEIVEVLGKIELRDVTINVNFPAPPWKGIKITRMGRKRYTPEIIKRRDPRGEPYYWIGIGSPIATPDEESDIKAINENYISITPIHADMTCYDTMKVLRNLINEMA